jgi:hypothetical protein
MRGGKMAVKKIYAKKRETARVIKKQVFTYLLPEILEAYGDLLPYYLRQAFSEVVNVSWTELNKLSKDVVKEYYEKVKHNRKGVYVREDIQERWTAIPFKLKKKAHYWINQWLLKKKEEVGL